MATKEESRLTFRNFHNKTEAAQFADTLTGWKHIDNRGSYIVVWYKEPGKPETGVQPYN